MTDPASFEQNISFSGHDYECFNNNSFTPFNSSERYISRGEKTSMTSSSSSRSSPLHQSPSSFSRFSNPYWKSANSFLMPSHPSLNSFESSYSFSADVMDKNKESSSFNSSRTAVSFKPISSYQHTKSNSSGGSSYGQEVYNSSFQTAQNIGALMSQGAESTAGNQLLHSQIVSKAPYLSSPAPPSAATDSYSKEEFTLRSLYFPFTTAQYSALEDTLLRNNYKMPNKWIIKELSEKWKVSQNKLKAYFKWKIGQSLSSSVPASSSSSSSMQMESKRKKLKSSSYLNTNELENIPSNKAKMARATIVDINPTNNVDVMLEKKANWATYLSQQRSSTTYSPCVLDVLTVFPQSNVSRNNTCHEESSSLLGIAGLRCQGKQIYPGMNEITIKGTLEKDVSSSSLHKGNDHSVESSANRKQSCQALSDGESSSNNQSLNPDPLSHYEQPQPQLEQQNYRSSSFDSVVSYSDNGISHSFTDDSNVSSVSVAQLFDEGKDYFQQRLLRFQSVMEEIRSMLCKIREIQLSWTTDPPILDTDNNDNGSSFIASSSRTTPLNGSLLKLSS